MPCQDALNVYLTGKAALDGLGDSASRRAVWDRDDGVPHPGQGKEGQLGRSDIYSVKTSTWRGILW